LQPMSTSIPNTCHKNQKVHDTLSEYDPFPFSGCR